MSGDKWMQAAVPKENRGKFTEKAKRAGESVHAYAEEKKGAKGVLGHEARFALVGSKVSKKNAAKRKSGRGK